MARPVSRGAPLRLVLATAPGLLSLAVTGSGCGNDAPFDPPPPGSSGSGGSGAVSGGGGSAGGTDGDAGSMSGDGSGGSDGMDSDTGDTGGEADGLIPDASTGALWFDAGVSLDHDAAEALCNDSTFAGYDDWILPPIQGHLAFVVGCDIQSVDTCQLSDPTCLDQVCGDTLSCPTCPPEADACYFDETLWGSSCLDESRFWSSSACPDCPDDAFWAYDFGLAQPFTQLRGATAGVRCARLP